MEASGLLAALNAPFQAISSRKHFCSVPGCQTRNRVFATLDGDMPPLHVKNNALSWMG
jgi:hypothetical protein